GPDCLPQRVRRRAVLVFPGQLDAQVICRWEGARIAVQGGAVVLRRLCDPARPFGDEPCCHEEDRILRGRGQGLLLQRRGRARIPETEVRQRGVVVQYLWPDTGCPFELPRPVKRVRVILHRGVQVARLAFIVRELLARVIGDGRELERRLGGTH